MSSRKAWVLMVTFLLLAALFSSLAGSSAFAQRPAPETASSPEGGFPSGVTRINGLSILHIYTRDTTNSVQRALDELGHSYDLFYGDDWTGIDFSPYDVVIIGMDGGEIDQPSIQRIRTDVIDQGKRVIFLGGTQWGNFVLGVNQYLVLNETGNYDWAISSTPHFTLVDPDHLLAHGLPSSYNFVTNYAAFYQLRATDPGIGVIGVNGDGYDVLFHKGMNFPVVGVTSPTQAGGDLIWFINSPYDAYWGNQADFNVLKQIIANALAFGWTAGTDDPFDFNRYDCVWFDDGTGPSAYNQKVYCMGGRTGGSSESPDIWRYDPLADTWEDTTHDMYEDVSNYTANLLEDENYATNGLAIYVVSGYDAETGTQTTHVQRYYPKTGVVELVSTDPWPLAVSGEIAIPGGCATVQNKIYCFGGWESVAAPYFSDQTWEYDPARPAGSRWLQIGTANLNQARAYIQVAVQNDVIYAMGGIYDYPPGDLVPSNVVEALDVNNLGAGWQVLAPMPVASGEGRGFGWAGKTYVAGGGDWPADSAEAMEYDIASNTWNQAFPDLITLRRDHAGALIPLCTADPTDGLPGMWVFGGRSGSDDPPFADPEYFPLQCFRVYLPLALRGY